MFRLNKLTDYGIVLMTCVAHDAGRQLRTARDLAAGTRLPLPTVVKILRLLMDRELLVSQRGVKGGYALARDAGKISVAEIIEALEGPIGFTECSTSPGCCELERSCGVRGNSQIIGRALHRALRGITLADLTRPLRLAAEAPAAANVVTSITLTSGRVQ